MTLATVKLWPSFCNRQVEVTGTGYWHVSRTATLKERIFLEYYDRFLESCHPGDSSETYSCP
jgi:hypothetical protein